MKPLLMVMLTGLLVAAACTGGGVEVAQVPTATLAPIVSMTPRFTATPVASRTPLPTFTYTPSDTPIPPTPSDTPTLTPTPPVIGIINSSQSVNIREGPGVSYRAITALQPGTDVEVLGTSSDSAWYNILMEDGSQGWVSSRLIYLEPSPTPFPTLTPTVDETAIALGTTYPTAILGGAPVTPTPPASVLTLTPGSEGTEVVEVASADSGGGVVNADALNATATALIGSITGNATSTAQSAQVPFDLPTGGPTRSGPVGGPTGGPVGGPTATSAPGQGQAGQSSSQDGVDVLAYCDNPLLRIPPPSNLTAGATIDVFWSWYARTEELLADHRENVIYEVEVDGQRLTNWRLYADPQVRFQDGNYYQYWYVPFGPLDAGEHVITYYVTWRNPISDGYDDFGPGTANPSERGTCTFTVR